MLRLSLALSTLLVLLISTAAYGQSLAKPNRSVNETASPDVNTKAIAALKHLDNDVIVYHSLADFEDGRKLARVSLPTFEDELKDVNAEVEPLLNEMPDGKFKLLLMNALASFRDGAFWWRKIDQPRVISVTALASSAATLSPANQAFVSTVPYAVAIHWRQAHEYLARAEQTVAR